VARKTTRRWTIGERRGGEHGTGWGRHEGVPGGGSTGGGSSSGGRRQRGDDSGSSNSSRRGRYRPY